MYIYIHMHMYIHAKVILLSKHLQHNFARQEMKEALSRFKDTVKGEIRVSAWPVLSWALRVVAPNYSVKWLQ